MAQNAFMNLWRRLSRHDRPGALESLALEAGTAHSRGDLQGAAARYRAILDARPDDAHALYWLATCLEQSGGLDEAGAFCDRALSLHPDQIGLLIRGGSIAFRQQDFWKAKKRFFHAWQLDPAIPDIDALLADQYAYLGNVDEAVKRLERAIAAAPTQRLQSNRLFMLNYLDCLSDRDLFVEHLAWGKQFPDPPPPQPRSPARIRANSPLRVGFISGDLRQHAVSHFIEPLFEQLRAQGVEVLCFDTSRHAKDQVTLRLEGLVTGWARVADLDDPALHCLIRDAELDILIDLSGHTSMNRLPALAGKPAPVIATWLGYLQTTGLPAIDYRITDSHLDPPGTTEHLHTETLVRLPDAAVMRLPPATASDFASLRAPSDPLQFGSVNQWSKVNGSVIEAWALILRKTMDARLTVLARGGFNGAFAADIVQRFAAHGVDAARIEVKPTTSFTGFLHELRTIDVCLDPFPYGGGTTTMHCLSMGVPVVTLGGTRPFARNSVGPVRHAGLAELIARNVEDYVRIASALEQRVVQLRRGRAAVGEEFRRSPLGDPVSFTASFLQLVRSLVEKM